MTDGMMELAALGGCGFIVFFLAGLAAHFRARARKLETRAARAVDAVRLVRSIAMQDAAEDGPGAAARLASIRRSAVAVMADMVDTGGND